MKKLIIAFSLFPLILFSQYDQDVQPFPSLGMSKIQVLDSVHFDFMTIVGSDTVCVKYVDGRMVAVECTAIDSTQAADISIALNEGLPQVTTLNGLVNYSGNFNQIVWTDSLRGGLFYLSDETIDSGTVYPATNKTGNWTRTRENSDLVNVAWFGAMGDSTDQTNAISRAIESKKGNVIYFPEGDYLAENILFRDGNIIKGECRECTEIIWIDNALASGADNLIARKVKGANRADVTVQDLTLNGNRENQPWSSAAVIASATCRNFTAYNVTFRKSKARAITVNTDENVLIEKCSFIDMGEHTGVSGQTSYGIDVQKKARKITIRDCYFHADTPSVVGQAPSAIFVSENADTVNGVQVIIEGCIIDGFGTNTVDNITGAITFYINAHNSIIRNTTIKNRRYAALQIQNSFNVTVEKLTVDNVQNTSLAAIYYQPAVRGYSDTKGGFTIRDTKMRNQAGSECFVTNGDSIYNLVIDNLQVDSCTTLMDIDNVYDATFTNIRAGYISTVGVDIDNSGGNIVMNDLNFRGSGSNISLVNIRTANSNLNFKLINSTLIGASQYGVTARDFNTAEIAVNRVEDCSTPFDIVNANTVTVVGNIATGITPSGITTLKEAGNSWNSESVTPTLQTVLAAGNTAEDGEIILQNAAGTTDLYLSKDWVLLSETFGLTRSGGAGFLVNSDGTTHIQQVDGNVSPIEFRYISPSVVPVADNDMLRLIPNDRIEGFFNGVKKFETNANGIEIFGDVIADNIVTYTAGDGINIDVSNVVSSTLGTSITTPEITNKAVINDKLADMPPLTIKGNSSDISTQIPGDIPIGDLYSLAKIDSILEDTLQYYVLIPNEITVSASRNLLATDIGNTISCTDTATITIPEDFTAMSAGETINLEALGVILTIQGGTNVEVNDVNEGSKNLGDGTIYTGAILRKVAANRYIVL